MKNKEVKISIVLGIYKIQEEYLKKCIESLINQTFKQIEIILIDDGSPDNCGKICDEYSKIDNRITVIHQDNQGISVARNNGMKKATGEWIVFVDPDDWVEEDMCEKMINYSQNANADIIIFNNYNEYLNKQTKEKGFNISGKLSLDNIEELKLQIMGKRDKTKYTKIDNVYAIWSRMYNSNFIKKNSLQFVPNMKKSQDVIFNIYSLECASNVYCFSEYLYHYRRSSVSITNRYLEEYIEYNEKLIFELSKFIDIFNKPDIYKQALKVRTIYTLKNYIFKYFAVNKNNKKYKEIKKDFFDLVKKDMYKSAIDECKHQELKIYQKLLVICIKHNFFLPLYTFGKFMIYMEMIFGKKLYK